MINELIERARLRLAALRDSWGLPQNPDSLLPPIDKTEALRLLETSFSKEPPRYLALLDVCGIEAPEACAVELALLWLEYPAIGREMALLGFPEPNLELALTVYRICAPKTKPFPPARQEEMFCRLQRLLVNAAPQPLFRRSPLTADSRLYAFLSGSDKPEGALAHCMTRRLPQDALPPVLTHGDALEKLTAELKHYPRWQEKPLIQLSGGNGSGRRHLLQHACCKAGLDMCFLDFRYLHKHFNEKPYGIVRSILREMFLYGMGACFVNIPPECLEEPGLHDFVSAFVEPLHEAGRPVVLCTGEDVALTPHLDRPVSRLSIPHVTRLERIALWQGYVGHLGIKSLLDWDSVGSLFRLSPGEIARAAACIARLEQSEGSVSTERLYQICQEILPAPAQGAIKRIEAHYSLEDIKLTPELKQKLKNICAHVRYQRLVYDDWNMESRYAYGRNVSALLVGPPGTGKTMAAQVLANELALPLYRVDISQVADKYIGEAEKRLEQIFTVAEQTNTILFFDEADAIFGKRSEVEDAHDRYANTETSYILQRIEQFDGIVLLATNYKKNIDDAFMRRMRYLLEFTLPAETQRLEIWQSAFAPETPLKDVDLQYLARQFELSGGSIKNVALNAAFLAADEGSAIEMRHILSSLRDENLKVGKSMLRQDFAEYGVLAP